MIRKIITYGGYFNAFLQNIGEKEKEKIEYGLMLLETQDRVSMKYIKHIRDGLFELRIECNGSIYRIFFIFDEGLLVVLFNGFQKKTQKTPKKEIEKALKIKEEYYESKRTSKRSSNS
jgi:putative addiction module killer protein